MDKKKFSSAELFDYVVNEYSKHLDARVWRKHSKSRNPRKPIKPHEKK